MTKTELMRSVNAAIDKRATEIIGLGETIRRHPELGFKEFKTARLVEDTMRGMGLSPKGGLAITGVPYPVLLTAVMFLLAVAQIGAGPVLFGAVIWLYWRDQTLWAIVMLIWSVITVSFDNVLRPVLIKRGADLPLVLIFAGVLGGLVAFGIVGLFVGPVVLAVTYTLLVAWVARPGEPRG